MTDESGASAIYSDDEPSTSSSRRTTGRRRRRSEGRIKGSWVPEEDLRLTRWACRPEGLLSAWLEGIF